jgi:antitoxin (DNA-binding transcriptional repressor) of toxin-antitoxin stability system
MVEKDNGVTQSETKVVWCESDICEERAADGTTVTRRASVYAEQVAGVARFFAMDPWTRRRAAPGWHLRDGAGCDGAVLAHRLGGVTRHPGGILTCSPTLARLANMITVNMHEAKTRLSELVKAVEERNETVVLCRDGRAVAEIRRRVTKRTARRLTPDPRFRVEPGPGYHPAEPLTNDEWPESLR